jgi:hypothetical protein
VNARLCEVFLSQGEHVGNLKRIGGVWKFKALAHDESGNVMPGHGPLTHHHNACFDALDEVIVNATLTRS